MTPTPKSSLSSSIHLIAPITVQPITVMTHWRLFQVRSPQGGRTLHLVGRADGEGRVCSALVSIDAMALTAVSRSGAGVPAASAGRLRARRAVCLERVAARHGLGARQGRDARAAQVAQAAPKPGRGAGCQYRY